MARALLLVEILGSAQNISLNLPHLKNLYFKLLFDDSLIRSKDSPKFVLPE